MMQLFLGISILSFGILATLAATSRMGRPKADGNRSFALMCLLMALYAFADAMQRAAASAAAADPWMRIATAAWHWAVTWMLFFGLRFTGRDRIAGSPVAVAALLAVPAALSLIELSVPSLGAAPVPTPAGWERYVSSASLLLPLGGGWEVGASLASVLLLAVHHRKAAARIVRRQAGWTALGLCMPLLAGTLTQAVLPALGIRVPSLLSLSGALLGLSAAHAMRRYGLFVLDPGQAADPLLSVMEEAVLLVDAGGVVVYANAGARRFWPDAPGCVGRPVGEVCGAAFRAAGGLERLLTDPGRGPMEVSWDGARGGTTALFSGTLLRDRLGDARGAVLVATDISGQKLLERTLQQSRRMLRDLIDNCQAFILMTDPQGVILAANAPFARRFGFTPATVVGQSLAALLPGAVGRDRDRRIAEVLASGAPMQFTDARADRHWEHRVTPVPDEEGRVAGVAIFSTDVTERVEAERTRERLIRELRDALGQVKTLTGLIPICAHCKRIRGDDGYWQQVEQYVAEHTDADFTHGLCSDCLRALYPELAPEVLGEAREPGRGTG